MKIKLTFTIIFSSIIVLGCGTTQKIKMSSNPMINEIIKDYYKSNKRYIKDYSVFSFERKEMKNSELEVYTVIPENNNEIAYKIYLEDSVNSNLPTNYLEFKDRLFLWRDNNRKVPDSVMQYIYNRKLVDSSYVKYQMGLISEEDIISHRITISESIYGVTYVMCNSEPLKIKKRIKSNKYINSDDKRLEVKCY